MKEPRKDEQARESDAGGRQAAPKAPADPRKPAGINYVFKIAPADPKNSFDFEDVADK
jgi:hypothetical protein